MELDNKEEPVESSSSMPNNEEDALLVDQREAKRNGVKKFLRAVWKYCKANMLLLLTILSVIIGLFLGLVIRTGEPSELAQQLIAFPGEIFLRALKMIILPLIIFSLIAGLGSLDIKVAGALGIRTIIYYATTTVLAVILGLILVLSIKPGSVHMPSNDCNNNTHIAANTLDIIDSIFDLMRNIVPDNLFTATYSQTHTEYYYVVDWTQCAKDLNISNVTSLSCDEIIQEINSTEMSCTTIRQKSVNSRDGMNILGIITFTIAFAMVLSYLGEDGRRIVHTISILNDAIMKLVIIVMWYSPIGIASIIAGKLLEVDSLTDLLQELGLYMLCVILGLFIHACLTLPVLFIIFARSNPLKLVRGALQALLVAFGTSSSSATLPVTIKCLEDKLGYDKRVTRFMLPVGATVNMDGTALYEAIAAVFIAQVEGVATDFAKVIVIALTATLASIGAAGVPQAGLVTLVIVLTAIGLGPENVALILAVDWLLDRFRTVVNVYGDCVGVGIVSRLSKKQLSRAVVTNPEEVITPPDSSLIIKGDELSSLERTAVAPETYETSITGYNNESHL